MTANLKQLVLAEARAAGFDAARVTTPAAIDPRTGQRLADFLQEGRTATWNGWRRRQSAAVTRQHVAQRARSSC
jgi:hypothetical protein